jgi:hypothetical protein
VAAVALLLPPLLQAVPLLAVLVAQVFTEMVLQAQS